MLRRLVSVCLLAACSSGSFSFGQEAKKPGQEAKPASASEFDMSAFIRETQQSTNEPGYAGLVWWIPTEYWEISMERIGATEEKAKSRYAALRKYTVVAVAVGKIGIGNIDWISAPEIRDNIALRDADGNKY